MSLPAQAERALEALRTQGRALRFEVTRICKSSRFRLSVRYRDDDEREVRVGLLYSDDAEELERLRARLERG